MKRDDLSKLDWSDFIEDDDKIQADWIKKFEMLVVGFMAGVVFMSILIVEML